MKKYFCDVCSVEIDSGGNAPSSWAAELCRLEDLCPRCDALVRSLDVSGLVMAELRRLIEERPEKPAIPGPAPALKGKAAREKKEILAAVEAYRQKNGPGSLAALARLAKVGEGELRALISCEKVPFSVWRSVGRTLGVTATAGKEYQ